MSPSDQQYLLDRLAIADLLTTYAHAVDTRDWDLFRSVFTDEAEIEDLFEARCVPTRVHEIEQAMAWARFNWCWSQA